MLEGENGPGPLKSLAKHPCMNEARRQGGKVTRKPCLVGVTRAAPELCDCLTGQPGACPAPEMASLRSPGTVKSEMAALSARLSCKVSWCCSLPLLLLARWLEKQQPGAGEGPQAVESGKRGASQESHLCPYSAPGLQQ